jgi:hypothetical protein
MKSGSAAGRFRVNPSSGPTLNDCKFSLCQVPRAGPVFDYLDGHSMLRPWLVTVVDMMRDRTTIFPRIP